ncbi:MAG: tol-pal system-associated acyl-CoA thioesterase [Methylococcaceae bacterium]|nr:tol-pal system-associated acyl-CoA thioesterase [Methylococcaceae bacterium]
MQPFNWPIRVYYEDTDAGGVVYYANYLKFFERARTEMLRAIGYEQDQLRSSENILFVVRALQIDYLSPAHFNDLLAVSSTVTEIKRTRILFDQVITKESLTLCHAAISIACLNATSMRPTAIPQPLLEQLQNEN